MQAVPHPLARRPDRPAPAWRQPVWWLFVGSLSAAHLGVWLGNAGAIALLGCWGLYAVLWPLKAVRAATRSAWPWALPGLALASTIWSLQPGLSARQGAEFLAFTGVGLLMGSSLSPRRITSAFLCGMLVVAVGGLLDGGTTAVQHAGSLASTGGLGSKNTFAQIGSFLLLAAVCCGLDRQQERGMRALAAGCVPLAVAVLVLTRSAGAVQSTAVALALVVPLSLAARIRRPWRGVVLALAAVVAVAAAGLAMAVVLEIGTDRLLADIGKDAGLSGRAYLWQRASELIEARPLLGLGYQAFWVQDTLDAEGLWRASGIASRYGFHFHSLYYETAVELGLLGVAVLAATITATFLRVIYWMFFVSLTEAAFFLALLAVLMVRAYGELDFLFPIADGTELLPMIFAAAGRRGGVLAPVGPAARRWTTPAASP